MRGDWSTAENIINGFLLRLHIKECTGGISSPGHVKEDITNSFSSTKLPVGGN